MGLHGNRGTDRARRRTIGLGLLAGLLLATAAWGQPDAFSWQMPHATVLDQGELEWAPEPFIFQAGPSVRYIDFEGGNDAADGLTPETAWKRHPWDPTAADNAKACSGPQTYVFKRGVIYRGQLLADESGTAEQPMILTSDPAWGDGEAVIAGSEPVTGWTKGARHPDMPDAERVWTAEVDLLPRSLWMVAEDGTVTRLRLARTPNWNVSDPEDIKSEWWVWQQPEFWKPENVYKTAGKDRQVHLGIDRKNLTRDADYYMDAVVWTEWGIVMGTPYPTRVEAFDAESKGIGFQGPYYGDAESIRTGHRYYLEDKPHYLDEPGEFWFERDGENDRGRLYVRLPDDVDPNTVRIEAPRHINLIDAKSIRHLRVRGLSFHFTNTFWDYTQRFFIHPDVNGAVIRILGSAEDIEVAHCRFGHVNKPVRIGGGPNDRLDRIVICDNDMYHLDRGAIEIGSELAYGKYKPPFGYVGDLKILRNRIYLTGLRVFRRDFGHTVELRYPETAEIAGNIISRTAGSSIFVFGGKGDRWMEDNLLTRILIHHNRVEDSLLDTNDWGGIETWHGGPFYIFNNISGNPGGYWNWKYLYDKYNARLGFAFYLDGSNKNYLFNNIAWGRDNTPDSKYANEVAFYEAGPRIMNSYFNNTAYNFRMGTNWSGHRGYHWALGNVWEDISSWVFRNASTKEDPPGTSKNEFPHHTSAYSKNVFHEISEEFGAFENNARTHATPESFRQALVERKALTTDLGVVAEEPVLQDPANHDFRPRPGSAAIDRGVKVFVPWALAATVGEWLFYPAGDDPTVILDQHWVMPVYILSNRQEHRLIPLTVANGDADSYQASPLEDWIDSALTLNGTDRYAFATHETMTAPYAVKQQLAGGADPVVFDEVIEGAELMTPDIHTSNLMVEVIFKAQPPQGQAVLVEKMDQAGYSLHLDSAGQVVFKVVGNGASAELASQAILTDGKWHHVIAELDRQTGTMTLYIDGRQHATGPGVGPEVSLANGGNLHMGGTPSGRCLRGAIDFVRIAQSTLAQSKTTIEELAAWQFFGPQYRDFTGRAPTGAGRDAGAIELAE